MADSFTRDLFAWLDAVAGDNALPALAFKLAYIIAKHINRSTGDAWPSQETLAAALGVSSTRCIRKLATALIARGHISVVIGKGPGQSNHYRLNHKYRNNASGNEAPEKRKNRSGIEPEKRNEASGIPPAKEEQPCTNSGTSVQEKRNIHVDNTGTDVPTNLLIEPSEEPSEEPTERPRAKKPRRSMPAVWPTERDIEWWCKYWQKKGRPDLIERAEDEAALCRDKHLALGTATSNWPAVARTWAQRAIPYTKPQVPNDRPRSGGASAAFGVDAALREFEQ